MARVSIVGSGQCGLLIARRLAEAGHEATLIERLPEPGGQEPEHPLVDQLADDARTAGASLVLGTAAVSFDGTHLHSLGVDGARHDPLDVLVIATGTRPRTRAELDISGDRCAGIVPGSAAVHLTESGVLLGRAPAIVGGGTLALECCELLLHAGADHVTLIAPDGVHGHLPDGVFLLDGWHVERAEGQARVARIAVRRGAERDDLRVDALILADGRIPMRNVEGAVLETPRVVFCHSSADPKSRADAERTVDEASDAVERSLHEHRDLTRSRT